MEKLGVFLVLVFCVGSVLGEIDNLEDVFGIDIISPKNDFNLKSFNEKTVDAQEGWVVHVLEGHRNGNFVATEDLDSDGDMDILSSSSFYYEALFHENDGMGNFSKNFISPNYYGSHDIDIVDIDGDGDLDFFSGDVYSCSLAWNENDGFENFVYNYIDYSICKISSVDSVDMDKDGDVDVLAASAHGDMAWYENDGMGNFSEHFMGSRKYSHEAIAEDVDLDGDMDILSVNYADSSVLWYENNGTDSFVTHIIASGSRPTDIFSGDLDSDGDIDVLASFHYEGRVSWYRNDGKGNFLIYNISVFGDAPSDIFAIDLDLDDDLDVLVSDQDNNSVSWYENDGMGNFDSRLISDSAFNVGSVSAGDVDLDGDLDVLAASFDEIIFWYESDFFDVGCNGSLNVFVRDSDGNELDDVVVKIEDESFRTDIFGEVSVNLECGDFDLDVFCSGGERLCDSSSGVISGNGDVDSMNFVCDVCREGKDIWINEDELVFDVVESGLMVSVEVHSLGLSKDVDVSLIKSCGGVKSEFEKQSVVILEGESQIVSFVGNFDDCEKIDVVVEYFEEENYYSNNFVLDYFVIEPMRVYLEVDSGYSDVDLVIEEFIGDYVRLVSAKSEADLVIYVGKKYGYDYLDDRLIRFEGLKEGLPYNGLVVKEGGELYVFGNEIEGTIAAVRRLVDERESYLNKRNVWIDMGDVYLGGRDVDAVFVYDYLHSDENVEFYRKEGKVFANIVDSILSRKTFNLEVKRVLTSNDGTSLRMKHIESEMSDEFRKFVGERAVVMAGGLFNDLEMWESQSLAGNGLAMQLALEDFRDVWEIEITGGPNTECESCSDYSYSDLVDYYWPALVAGVQYYTGTVSVDYVGFSNGCRVALSSLEKYQESGKVNAGVVDGVDVDLEGSSSMRVVDSFVGVGCPGAFEGESFLTEQVGKHPRSAEELRAEGMRHVDRDDIIAAIACIGLPGTTKKISLNLWEYYNDAIISNTDFQPGNFNVNRLRIIYGWGGLFNEWGEDKNERNDGMVTEEDSQHISDSITSNNLDKLYNLQESHSKLPLNNQIKEDIRRFLDNEN